MGGVRAAIEFGASLIPAAADRDLYLSRSAFGQLDSLVAAVPDPLGQIRLRVVDDDEAAWGIISGGEFAPRGAVALDLLEIDPDPRHWIAAEGLVADA